MKSHTVFKRQKFQSHESGAIMLEVIAVLSLMALMGAVLYRQIYLRNQELSNVQMASEIRMVKEAFASWIQANPNLSDDYGKRADLDKQWVSMNITDVSKVQRFLPESHRSILTPQEYYKLFFRCVDLEGRNKCYGLVLPTFERFPEEDWNFKRAAHVAMLIGADGGVFGDGLTNNESGKEDKYVISGSMGSWTETLDASEGNLNCEDDCVLDPLASYAATTGLDIFQPEIELPAVPVGLEKDARFALERVHVYGALTAGDDSTNSCYDLNHTESTPNGSEYILKNDDVTDSFGLDSSKNCWPAFYVEGGGDGEGKASGNVRVANDLSVGYDYAGDDAGKAAMRFDKNGMIVFEKAVIKSPESDKEINYLLDPQYTSVMNDVKIMSRGGAKLSEILPTYLVKEMKMQEFNQDLKGSDPSYDWQNADVWVNVAKPSCPKGYHPAISVQPTSRNTVMEVFRGSTYGATSSNVRTDGLITSDDIFNGVFVNVSVDSTEGTISASLDNSAGYSFALYDHVCVAINDNDRHDKHDNEAYGYHEETTTTEDSWKVWVGYWWNGECTISAKSEWSVWALIQTYCVFDPKGGSMSKIGCEKYGWTYKDGKCYAYAPSGDKTGTGALTVETGGRSNLTAEDCQKITRRGTCELMGCRWDGSPETCHAPSSSP